MRHPLSVLLLSCAAGCAMAPPMINPPTPAKPMVDSTAPAPAYPATRRIDTVDTRFGTAVADPYRWLENDVRSDPEVADWVARQNRVTDNFLATLPLRDEFKARMTALYDYERFGVPQKAGGRYFYTHNDGLQNQSLLLVRDSVDGAGRVLIDPNGWSKDGATALAEWTPSEDGRLLAYAVQDGGTDWRTVRILDTVTGKLAPDELKWLKYSGAVEWAKDGSGFYYSRFPAPAADQTFQGATRNQRVYFHRLGSAQVDDRLVYATPDHPDYGHDAQLSEDGRWLVITTDAAKGERYDIILIDRSRPQAAPRPLVTGFTNDYSFVGGVGTMLYFRTDKGAARHRLVSFDVSRAVPVERTVIPEDAATLDAVTLVGGKLIASYLVDARSELRVYSTAGQLERTVALPGIGSAEGFGGKASDGETFYGFSSFNVPGRIYRYDIASGQSSLWASPKVAFNPDDFTVEQKFYLSKDGTRVPMFIVRKAATVGPAPTLLYGYGGFNVSLTPSFSPTRLAWIEKGGVFALANIRGGGEYGQAWHDGGTLGNKQNVFDDFIAAGEYLMAQGLTGAGQLAIEGGSNGGLLVGAVVNQRPDLFAAAHPSVGVMDMLRFDRFTAGRYWVADYGDPSIEADFRHQLAYSPYHNIAGGRAYPAVLVTTADTDDRVVPGHSFKYIARLQNTPGVGHQPHLIRIETRAGHGSGKPTAKIIEEASDVYAFLGHFTGMDGR